MGGVLGVETALGVRPASEGPELLSTVYEGSLVVVSEAFICSELRRLLLSLVVSDQVFSSTEILEAVSLGGLMLL